MSNDLITCPHCHEEFDVSQTLYQQIKDELQREYLQKAKHDREQYEADLAKLADERRELLTKEKQLDELVATRIAKELKQEEAKLKKAIGVQIREEQSEELRLKEEELEAKSKQIIELRKVSAEVSQLKREKAELTETITAQAQEKYALWVAEEKDRLRRELASASELKIKELEKQLEDQKRLTDEMKQKQEQGSMQLQGEVQELAIEEWLRSQFPVDTIEEIKKGEYGADCLQTVNTPYRQNCGTIYYESKRTKTFRRDWLEKLKLDLQAKNAQIAVLVTSVMPGDMERMGFREGIWICSFDEFKSLCAVLRESLISVSNAMQAQENKGEKMTMLYDFLTSREFQDQVASITEGFVEMQQDLEKEKRSMQKLWKQREKQIEKVLRGTTAMYGSIKGIAGSSFLSIPQLDGGD
ncbi:MAG: DUF2130 domain-containing protein [Oscillatoriales cyanobacterium]|nr:MAG: DUF2130 domain-containing protein [Oscillatoriales cyanobacterium]